MFSRCLLAAFLVMPALVHAPGQAQPRAEFAWHCSEFTLLRYRRDDTNKRPFSSVNAADWHTVARGQIDADGNWTTGDTGKHEVGELALRFASMVPGKAPGRVRSWTREFDSATIARGRTWLPDQLKLTGSFGSANDGVVKYRVEARGEDAEGDPAGTTDRKIGPFSLVLECEFDCNKGWLRKLSADYDGGPGIAGVPNAEKFSYALDDSLTFADRAAFEKDITIAIQTGLHRVDTIKHEWEKRPGHAALAAYTMLQCGRKATDPEVTVALAAMIPAEGKPAFTQQYHAAALILATEAKYIGDEERRQVLAGKSPSAFRRALSVADRALMEAAIAYIGRSQVAGIAGAWAYGEGIGTEQVPDLSNAQFAIMALAAATRCEVVMPAGLVKSAGEVLLKFRQPTGPVLKRVISRDKKGNWTRAKEGVEARGFSYYRQDGTAAAAYGSITGAGVCCALLLLDIYESWPDERKKAELGKEAKDWRESLRQAIEGGLAWLESHWTVAGNPLYYAANPTHYCCYLYSLERVGALARTAIIGPHEWYTEGAMALLQAQDRQGGWGQFEDTAFALLFLSRATTPTRSSPTTGR